MLFISSCLEPQGMFAPPGHCGLIGIAINLLSHPFWSLPRTLVQISKNRSLPRNGLGVNLQTRARKVSGSILLLT
eukprot:12405635-Karenia_brevis.AAC.1